MSTALLLVIVCGLLCVAGLVGSVRRQDRAAQREWWSSIRNDRAAIWIGGAVSVFGVVIAVVNDSYLGIPAALTLGVLVAAAVARARARLSNRS
jgi:hypothetical protein